MNTLFSKDFDEAAVAYLRDDAQKLEEDAAEFLSDVGFAIAIADPSWAHECDIYKMQTHMEEVVRLAHRVRNEAIRRLRELVEMDAD